MALSTSRTSCPDAERFGLAALDRFYRWQAPLYDWTRPFFLLGRGRLVDGFDVGPGHLVLDVGCGTGWSFPRLLRRSARVVGIEVSEPMRRRAGALGGASLDGRPYGTHDEYRGQVDRVLFSYSLSMIPPYAEAIESARADLRRGGRVGVVDFLDARPPFDGWLRRSCVFLGDERLDALRAAFPHHRLTIESTPFWRYFLFWGEAPA
jgi:S-adenosylmethionine-diacylgycerolhomoserine-N-methlytransferase